MAGNINSEDPDTLFFKYNVYERLCNLKRGKGVPIRDLIDEFEIKYLKIREQGIWVPDYIAGFMLLSACMLPEEKIFTVMSVIWGDVGYDSMKTAILSVFSQGIDTDDSSSSEEEVEMESELQMEPMREIENGEDTNEGQRQKRLRLNASGEEIDGGQKEKRLKLDESLSIPEEIPNKKKEKVRLDGRTSTCP